MIMNTIELNETSTYHAKIIAMQAMPQNANTQKLYAIVNIKMRSTSS